jgi:drug/metabolite transporter (DMT)-like permease
MLKFYWLGVDSMMELDYKALEIKKTKAYVELLITAFSWSLSTVILKMYIDSVPPFHLLMGRFVIGSIFIFAMRPNVVKSINKENLKVGIPLGFMVFVAYTCGVVCLKYTSASKSSFLVSLSVLLVPIFESIMSKKMPSRWTAISVFISFVGLRLISGINGSGFNFGDGLAILSAVFYSAYILMMDRNGKDIDDMVLTLIQLGVVSFCCIIAVVLFEGFSLEYIKMVWVPILIIGILCTGIATLCQTRAQKVASTESVGILLLGEPLFTLIMAFFILKETILLSGIIGGALILASLVLAVIKKI